MRWAALLVGSVTALLAASPAFAADGLVGWWPLDEGSGVIAHDFSGHADDGTISGSTHWIPGYFGSALGFDGNAARVDVPNNAALQPNSAVSVSAWVQGASDEGAYQSIIAKGVSGCTAASYAIYTGPNGGLIFYISQNHGLSYTRSPDAGRRVWDGNWHFVVGTYDGSRVRPYVDGTEVGNGTPLSGPIGYGLPDGNNLTIGHYDGCPNLNFIGAVDEAMIWNRALSSSEIVSAYDSLVKLRGGGPIAPSTPLTLPPPLSSAPPPSSRPPHLVTDPSASAVSNVFVTGLAAGMPRLGFTVTPSSTGSPIKSFRLTTPKGLHFVRNLRHVRAGVRAARAGKYILTVSHGHLLLVLLRPTRALTITVGAPALAEDPALIKRVRAVVAFNRIKTHRTKRVVTLRLAMRLTDSTRATAPLGFTVEIS